MTIYRSIKSISLSLFISLIHSPTMASPIEQVFADQCQSCHDLSRSAPSDLKQLWERKAPDLSSAGIKYKADWVQQWLQHPTRIRPAGMYYGKHIKTVENKDQIDPSSLIKHPTLTSEDSTKMVAMLMALKQKKELVKQGDYIEGTVPKMLGEMMFDKFKGCLACHQIEPGYGGVSGPEVYTLANRLQEDYLISFMRNPQAWNPKTIMPNKHLKPKDLQKLVHYFRALSKENFK